MKVTTLYIVLLLGLLGCKNNTDQNQIFFGGEIINPKSNFVLLMQHEEIIDTILLKNDNTFGKSISNITSGLYSFKHGYEFQYIYFVPKDSLSIRLNTWDFDNTLVFDGKGAERNELLLDIFKGNETASSNFYNYASLSENQFIEKTAAATLRQTNLLDDFIKTGLNEPDTFIHLAKGAINYPMYRLKELYPYWHSKVSSDSTFAVSDNYYDFRQNINLNDSILSQYYSYRNFVSTYLYKIANKTNGNKGFNENFRLLLLESIVKEIKIPSLKNQLLFNEIYPILYDDSCQLSPKHLNLFYKNSTDSIAVNKIKLLLEDKGKLAAGSEFPDFLVTNQQNKETSIHRIIKNKNTVLYYWSVQHISTEYLEKRIRYLTSRFPDVNFIGIQMNEKQKKVISTLKDIKNQYYLNPNSTGNDLVRSSYPRTILIDSLGKVRNSFALLTNTGIEHQIKGLRRK